MSSLADYERLYSSFDEVAHLIESSHTIAICGHTDPDGDALGSAVAMRGIIEIRWPDKDVCVLTANNRSVSSCYSFLDGFDSFVAAVNYNKSPDLFISVDTPRIERLQDAACVLKRARHVVAFDHHVTMNNFGEVNCLVTNAASNGDIIYEFLNYIGVQPNIAVANAILAAVLTDTGRFQYLNTDAHAFEVASKMVAAGASANEISSAVYMSSSIEALHLDARVLERLTIDSSSRIAYSYVTKADLLETHATDDDCEDLIDLVRQLGGVDACLFMREKSDGTVRGNLRSKVNWLDVSAVAALYGGGGHKAAAGFTVQMSVTSALPHVLEALRIQIHNDYDAYAKSSK